MSAELRARAFTPRPPSSFMRPPLGWRVGDGLFVLAEPFEYHRSRLGSCETIAVPRGFLSDGASIPRPFWWLLPRDGVYYNAALLHDLLYHDQSVSRAEADAVLLEACEVLGVCPLARWSIYGAVRVFGGLAWRGNTRMRMAGRSRMVDVMEAMWWDGLAGKPWMVR